MKILGGKNRGRNFYLPKDLRATQNIVRKALFDMLGQDMEGESFLDLFAGSGANGLEAHSRGAKSVVFVEKDPKHVKVIEGNIEFFATDIDDPESGRYDLLSIDAFAAIKELKRKKLSFDVIFADPPYSRGLAKKVLKVLSAYDILQPNCVVVMQHDRKEILPKSMGNIVLFRSKNYGMSCLTFYKLDSDC